MSCSLNMKFIASFQILMYKYFEDINKSNIKFNKASDILKSYILIHLYSKKITLRTTFFIFINIASYLKLEDNIIGPNPVSTYKTSY